MIDQAIEAISAMNNNRICQMFEEYGISSECTNDKNDRLGSDVIHYPLVRETDLNGRRLPRQCNR